MAEFLIKKQCKPEDHVKTSLNVQKEKKKIYHPRTPYQMKMPFETENC